MEYRILGPLEVLDGGRPVALGTGRERRLLAALLLSANRVVSTDTLIDVLWHDNLPPRALSALQVYVSKLRRKLERLGATPIRTEHPGYVLRTASDELDAELFEQLVRSAGDESPKARAEKLRAALSLWRGEAVLSGLVPEAFRAEAVHLEELRFVAIEQRMEAELSLGQHHQVLAELESVAREHPLREGLQGTLMTALYRCGRQADALAVYRRTRAALAEELGIDPSKSLQGLEVAILNQAPELSAPATSPVTPAQLLPTSELSTLTFLFTDIEKSTELLASHPKTYTAVLSEHHQIIRSVLATHNGREVVTAGDGFFAVFTSPSACVSAAIEMQRTISSHEWPRGHQLRVRMGIHTGEASEETVGPVGLDVHKAARISAVARGGQVLVSGATTGLLGDALPTGARLRPLGTHRLKDLSRPEMIFQLEAEGLEANFPPLRSLDNPELPNNLPVQASSFIGRQHELDELRSVVSQSRLVTLIGAGGVGKTRLALQAAAELLDGSGEGVWFVDLAPISDPELVPSAVGAVLGVKEEPGRPLSATLLDFLRDRYLLLILDNCEHLVDACAKIVDAVLHTCPNVHILATSREALAIEGERVQRVPSLSLPEVTAAPLSTILEGDAVRLFLNRARERGVELTLSDDNLPAVVALCRRLDGIPLALEMAAARLSSMSLSAIEERLDQRFRLLTGGSRATLPRHQTLRALVDWSFQLLHGSEKAVLCRLSVFVGGFRLEQAEAVGASGRVEEVEVAQLLASLVDKSLVQADAQGTSIRYRLLETIRDFAAEQLAEDRDDTLLVRERHAEIFLRVAEEAAPHLRGDAGLQWRSRLSEEIGNLRAALDFLVSIADAEKALRLAFALDDFWRMEGLYAEGAEELRAALNLEPGGTPSLLRARALASAGELSRQSGDNTVAAELFDAGMSMARVLDDPGLLALLLIRYAEAALRQNDSEQAASLSGEALTHAHRSGDESHIASSLQVRATALSLANPDEARADLKEAFVHAKASGETFREAAILGDWSMLEAASGNLDLSRSYGEQALALVEGRRYATVMPFLQNLSVICLLQRDPVAAARYLTKALAPERYFSKHYFPPCVLSAALCASAVGVSQAAARLHGAADAATEDLGFDWEPFEAGLRATDRDHLSEVLGEGAFAEQYETGHALVATEAVKLAREICSSVAEVR